MAGNLSIKEKDRQPLLCKAAATFIARNQF